jgi:DNA replication protein DnaC
VSSDKQPAKKASMKISVLIGEVTGHQEIKTEVCSCGETVSIIEAPLIGGPRKGEKTQYKKGCKCEDKKLAREAWKIHQEAQQNKAKELFELNSIIPPKLKKGTLENYIPQNESQEKAKERLQKYAEHFDPESGVNILLAGQFGTGKSHLTLGALKLILNKGYTAVFVDLPQLFSKIKATFRQNSETSEEDLLRILKTADILVLDDLGAEAMTDWRKETLLQLINARAGRCTLYTSNLNKGEMIQHLGERNYSKWAEGTEIFKITGKDMRVEK